MENKLLNSILKGLQDKKGHNIVVADLRNIDDTICQFFVIATGGSPSHVHALAMNVGDVAREEARQKPVNVDGQRMAQWIAMDYGDIMVHIMLEEMRDFYDIEHLWADAKLTEYEDEF